MLPEQMTIERQFTIKEVSEMVKVSVRTVQRWIKIGRLTANEIPGRGKLRTEYRISKSAIEAIGFKVIDPEEDEDS